MRAVILGNGGHARALAAVLKETVTFLENDDDVLLGDVVYIGIGDIEARIRLYSRFWNQIPNRGVQLMERVHIGPNVVLGDNVLVNTGAQIDHDCKIGMHSIISPGAILCGGVILGEACQIGAGAIVLQGVELNDDTKIPAGSLVVEPGDIRKPVRVVRDGKIEAVA